jgi:hypothetical protein
MGDVAAHARFSPSGASRWMTCPGSIALTRDIPNPGSEYSAEGTAAHTLASRALEYGHPAAFWLGEQIQVEGRVFTVDNDMADHVQAYVDDVLRRVAGGTLLVEQRVGFSEAIGVEAQFGTADAIILSADGAHAIVEDLKYGRGVQVYATENKQLMTYAVAVLETFETIMEGVENITLVVAQPRLDHYDEWTVSVERLREHAAALRLAAGAALEGLAALEATGEIPKELFRPSEDACFFCLAKPTCEALRQHVSQAVFNDFEALDDADQVQVMGVPEPSIEKLGALYGELELIEDWCRGVRSRVEGMVMAGMDVIGPDGQRMKLIEGKRGNRRWADEQKAEAILAGILPPDKLYKPRELVTPSKVDKLVNKKATKQIWEDMVAPLVVQGKGRPKVALGSHPAPAWVPEAGADEFEDLDDAGGAE